MTCSVCSLFKDKLTDVNVIYNDKTDTRGLIGVYDNRTSTL